MTTEHRRPMAATQSAPMPSLDAVTARREPGGGHTAVLAGATGALLLGGVVMAPTQPPVCGPTRASELSAHVPSVLNDLRGGHGLDALADMAVAMGWRAHQNTQTQVTAGAISAVRAQPVEPLVPTVPPDGHDEIRAPMGAPPAMTVVPPTPQAHRHRHTDRAGHQDSAPHAGTGEHE